MTDNVMNGCIVGRNEKNNFTPEDEGENDVLKFMPLRTKIKGSTDDCLVNLVKIACLLDCTFRTLSAKLLL